MVSRSLLLLLVLLLFPSVASAGVVSPPADFTPFAADGPINLALRSDAPLHPLNAQYRSWIDTSTVKAGGWFNYQGCNMPIYWVDSSTPRVKVTLDPSKYQDPAIIKAWSSVPIPADLQAAQCSDSNAAVLQVQPDGSISEWEFWVLKKVPDDPAVPAGPWHWQSSFGGKTDDVKVDRGVASSLQTSGAGSQMNVTATGVSMMAGVVTLADMQRGYINHAVAIAAPDAAKYPARLWPAQRTDGGLTVPTDPTAPQPIPEGAKLRLPADFDIAALNLPPIGRMVAEALQKYGGVVRDRTFSSWVFYGELVPVGQTNPYTVATNGVAMWKIFDSRKDTAHGGMFPWDALQVLDAKDCTSAGYGACKADNKVVIQVAEGEASPQAGHPVLLDTTNSVLDQPRTAVRWDLNGDGTYETDGGKAVKFSWTPAIAVAAAKVGVQITTRDGKVQTGLLTTRVRCRWAWCT